PHRSRTRSTRETRISEAVQAHLDKTTRPASCRSQIQSHSLLALEISLDSNRVKRVLSASRMFPGNQPGGPVARHIVIRPLEQHQGAVAKRDQVHEVNEQPGQPGKIARE